MRCISEEEGRKLLVEIHAGLSGHHAASWALVSKAFRTGFYWPTARADAEDFRGTIPVTWPFAVWGLDMVGPLKGGTHKQKYLLVMGTNSPNG